MTGGVSRPLTDDLAAALHQADCAQNPRHALPCTQGGTKPDYRRADAARALAAEWEQQATVTITDLAGSEYDPDDVREREWAHAKRSMAWALLRALDGAAPATTWDDPAVAADFVDRARAVQDTERPARPCDKCESSICAEAGCVVSMVAPPAQGEPTTHHDTGGPR